MRKIAIASDHGGFELKETVIAQLLNDGWEIDDLGPNNEDSVDYPDYGIKLAEIIPNKKAKQISANKVGIAPKKRDATNFKVFIFVVLFLFSRS